MRHPPNELRATLRAETRAATAAAAQAAINRAVAAALERARAVPSARASPGSYWTSRTEEPIGWQTSRTPILRSEDAAALLDLVGALQGGGPALADLGWSLAREAERAAREEAGRIALESLQRRATAVAVQLGMSVAGLREVQLDALRVPSPRPMAMAVLARAAVLPPPVAVPEDAVVGATVEADVALRPGR